jgi:tetratricopeptide (TPR) repeat protein
MIPLFAFTFTDSLGRYVPEWWFKRYSVDEGVTIKLPYGFKMEKTEKLSIQAFDLRDSGRYEEAITVYKKALELEPQNPKLYFDISECYALSNNLESAIASLEKAIEIDSSFAPFYNNRGLLYSQLGKNQQAVDDHKLAVKFDSTEGVYYGNLALALYDLKLTSGACENIRKAEALRLDISGSQKLKVIKNCCHQQNL